MKLKVVRRISLLTWLLLTCSHLLFGQNKLMIDSLKTELIKQQADTSKIKLLLAIASQYSTSDTKNALAYVAQARKVYTHVDSQKFYAEIILQEGIIYLFSANYPKAMEQVEKALSIYNQIKMRSMIAECYFWIAGIYNELAKSSKALSYCSEAMKIYKQLNDNQGMSYCYKLMATIYCKQTNYNNAIVFAKKSIELADKNNKYEMAGLYLNLFVYYCYIEEYIKPMSLIDSIFPPLKEANDFDALGKAYINLGSLYMAIKNYEKAKVCILNSIYYCSRLGNIKNIIDANISLAWLYSQTNMLDSAIYILKRSIDLNTQLKNDRLYERLYSDIYAAYERKGDTKSAFKYYKKFIAVGDTLMEDITNKKLLELQTQYEVDLKNEQIKLLVKDKQLAKQKIIILGTGLLLMLISSLFFISYKHRKTKEKQLLHEGELKEASYKIGIKQRELTYKAIHISQQEQILSYVRDKLESFKVENPKTKETILELLSGINRQLKQNSFEDFEKYFIDVHPEFYEKLKQNYPDLSQNDLKVCALIRLNLHIKQIADITGRTTRSVENSRYIIRKKMGLSLQDNLFEIISSF